MSNTYNLKAVDLYTSNIGYFFKVALKDANGHYKLVYAPFGRFPSLLMSEFLASKRSELPVELIQLLQEAIKQEAAGTDEGFIILSDSIREQNAEIDGQYDLAVRPNKPKDLKLFKQVFLASYPKTRDLDTLSNSKVAYRVIGNELHIEFQESAVRDAVRELHISEEQRQAQRDFIHDLLVNNGHWQAQRDYVHDLTLGNQFISIRDIKSDLSVMTDQPQSMREIKAGARIERDRVDAIRDAVMDIHIFRRATFSDRAIQHPVINVQNQPLGRREVLRRLFLHEDIKARRSSQHSTFISKYDRLIGKLKGRQYPALLVELLRSVRDNTHHLALEHIMQQGHRHKIRDLAHIDLGPLAQRIITRQITINERIYQAHRHRIFGLYLERQSQLSSRQIFRQMDIMCGQQGERTFTKTLFVPSEQIAGYRRQKSLYIPTNTLAGGQKRSKNLYMDSVQYRAERDKNKPAYLDGKGANSGNKAPYPADHLPNLDMGAADPNGGILPEIDLGYVDLRGAHITEQMLGVTPTENPAYFLDLMLTGATARKLYGQLIEQESWGNTLNERVASFLDVVIAFKGFYGELMDDVIFADRFAPHISSILDVIFGHKEFLGDLMDDVLVGDRYHDGQSWTDLAQEYGMRLEISPAMLAAEFLESVRERLNALLDTNLPLGLKAEKPGIVEGVVEGQEEAKPSVIEDVILADEPPLPSQIHIENPFGYFEAQPSFLGTDLHAYEEPKPSHIENDAVGYEEPKPSHIEDDAIGYEEPKPSHIENEVVGHEEPKPAVVGDGLHGHEEAKPSVIGEDLLGDQEAKPSVIEIDLAGGQEPKPSHISQDLLGKEQERPGTVGDHYDLGEEQERSAATGDEGYLGQEPERPATLDESIAMDKLQKPSLVEEGMEGEPPLRPSDYGEGIQGDPTLRPSAYSEGVSAHEDPRPSHMEIDNLLSDLQNRVSLLETGYIFADRPDERASYIAEIYFLGDEGVRAGVIDDSEWQKFATLALNQAIVGEQMFGSDPGKASELLEDILGHFEPQPSHINEDGVAFTEPFPAQINADLVAKKQEYYADLISGLTGDKELAEAIIQDYIIAQNQLKAGFIPQQIFGKEELKKAFIEQGKLAQSFVYDYNDDILEDGTDPEFWEGGYAVPQPYDPHDPYNDYYPWAEDLNKEELNADDWVRFGPGSWERNKPLYEFQCTGASEQVSGYYRNDFTHEDYQFEIDFKVDDPADDDAAGIVFRYVNNQNYYMFMVTGGDVDGTFGLTKPMQLYRVVGGVEQMMGPPMSPFPWVRGQWHSLKVIIEGNRIRLWVNGRMQYDLID